MQKNLKQFKIPRKSNSFKIHANVSLYLNTLSKVRKPGCTPKLVISFKIKNKEQIYSFMVYGFSEPSTQRRIQSKLMEMEPFAKIVNSWKVLNTSTKISIYASATNLTPMLPQYRNQSVDVQCKSIDWFSLDGSTNLLKWDKPEVHLEPSRTYTMELFCENS